MAHTRISDDAGPSLGGRIVLDTNTFAYHNGTRDRITANNSNTFLTSPDGDMDLTITNTAISISDPNRTRFIINETGATTITSSDGGTIFDVQDTDIVCTSTTGGFIVMDMTTTQRDTLTPTIGMIIYNTTVSKHQGYNGSWNDFY